MCQKTSQPIDRPVDKADELPSNIQRPVEDDTNAGQQFNDALQGMYSIQVDTTRPELCIPAQGQTSLGDAQINHDEPTPLFHGSSSSITPSALSTTMPLYTFNATSLLMGQSFGTGNQYSGQGFGDPTLTDIDLSNLQGPNTVQEQEGMPSDLWFDNLSSSLSEIQSIPADDSSSCFPDLLPNSDAQELYLPDAYPSSLFQPDIVPIAGVNLPPPTPLTGALAPHATPLLASIPSQGYPPTQLPATGLTDGKDSDTVLDGRQGGGTSVTSQGNPGNRRKSTRKRKANDALVDTKDGSTPKPKKRHAKQAEETVGDEATEATAEETVANRLEKEAEVAQEVAIEATKAAKVAKVAAKEAKEARKVEKPGPARRSGRVPTLPDHLKEVGYSPPRRGSRANKKSN